MTEITIPGSVTQIGDLAFSSCLALTTVTVEDGVEEIGKNVFNSCSKLDTVIIPASVTFIDSGAFTGSSNLTIYGEAGSYAELFAESQSAISFSTGMPQAEETIPETSARPEENTETSASETRTEESTPAPATPAPTAKPDAEAGEASEVLDMLKSLQDEEDSSAKDDTGKTVDGFLIMVLVIVVIAAAIIGLKIKKPELYAQTMKTIKDKLEGLTRGPSDQESKKE